MSFWSMVFWAKSKTIGFCLTAWEAQNPKHGIRNSKQFPMTKIQITQTMARWFLFYFCCWNIRICFGFRYSDFEFGQWQFSRSRPLDLGQSRVCCARSLLDQFLSHVMKREEYEKDREEEEVSDAEENRCFASTERDETCKLDKMVQWKYKRQILRPSRKP